VPRTRRVPAPSPSGASLGKDKVTGFTNTEEAAATDRHRSFLVEDMLTNNGGSCGAQLANVW
jgi:hypothetical protein